MDRAALYMCISVLCVFNFIAQFEWIISIIYKFSHNAIGNFDFSIYHKKRDRVSLNCANLYKTILDSYS